VFHAKARDPGLTGSRLAELISAWCVALLAATAALIIKGVSTSVFDPLATCQTYGLFNTDDNNLWGLSGFFQINLSFGPLTFTQAKLIDVAWEIVRTQSISKVLLVTRWD
jgi:hypothetical protein